jgi:hypothetical protein
VRVVRPNELMREAASVLEPVHEHVVVIGAVAVQAALDGHSVALTPTRDVDAAVKTAAVDRVIDQLRAAGLEPSSVAHERSFTWVRGQLKVQLLRPFHPFPKGPAKGLPVSNVISELDHHRALVAFEGSPQTPRFWVASPAALVGLKEAAFGRTRPGGEPVDRDFSDVALLLDRMGEQIAEELHDRSSMRQRAARAAERLLRDGSASAAAARELVLMGEHDTHRHAEIAVRRAAQRFLRLLD